MGVIADITGQSFGRLVALHPTGRKKRMALVWALRCACGRLTESIVSNLRNGTTRSCGCLHRENAQRIGTENLLKPRSPECEERRVQAAKDAIRRPEARKAKSVIFKELWAGKRRPNPLSHGCPTCAAKKHVACDPTIAVRWVFYGSRKRCHAARLMSQQELVERGWLGRQKEKERAKRSANMKTRWADPSYHKRVSEATRLGMKAKRKRQPVVRRQKGRNSPEQIFKILEWRFIKNKPLKKIAEEFGYSIPHICSICKGRDFPKLHAEWMNTFKPSSSAPGR